LNGADGHAYGTLTGDNSLHGRSAEERG